MKKKSFKTWNKVASRAAGQVLARFRQQVFADKKRESRMEVHSRLKGRKAADFDD